MLLPSIVLIVILALSAFMVLDHKKGRRKRKMATHHVHHFHPFTGRYRYDHSYGHEIWEWLLDRCSEGGETRHHIPPQKYHPGRTVSVDIILGPIIDCDSVIMGVNSDMALALLDTQKVVLTAVAKDVDGNVTSAALRFSSSDDTIVSLVDNGDGTAVASAGADGTASVTATATNADGTEVSSDPFDIEVSAVVVGPNPAATVEVTAGTPEDK